MIGAGCDGHDRGLDRGRLERLVLGHEKQILS
jgi:hypothetical protein